MQVERGPRQGNSVATLVKMEATFMKYTLLGWLVCFELYAA